MVMKSFFAFEKKQKVLRKYVKIDTNKKLLLKQQTELQKHKLGKKLTIGLM